MVTTLGTILGTSLGTELGSMQDVAGFDTRFLYALSNFSGANWYETSTGGGEPGIATGFGFIVLCRLWQNVATTTRAISDNFYTGPVEGWTLNSTGTNTGVQAAFVSGAAASIGTPVIPLTPSDNGRILTLVGQHTGAGALARLSVFRGTYQTSAVTGYTPSARKTGIGKRANVGNIPADGVEVLAKIAFRGVPTDAELNAYIDAVRALGDLPRTPIGSTPLTHRWSLRDYLAGLDLPVTNGQVAPASLPDTVTAAAIDRMDRQGSPTIVSIDPGVDGRKTYGALGNSPTAYLESAAGKGIRGAATGLTVLVLMRLDAAPSGTGHLVSDFLTTPSAMGYVIYGSSSQIYVYLNASNFTPICAAAAADVGRMMLVGVTWNGTTWQGYRDGATAGTPMTAGWANPNSTAPMQIGRSPHDTTSASFASIFAVAGCDVALSGAEMAQVYTDFLRTGRLIMPGGKPNAHSYELTADITANGGPDNGVPATAQDRIGTDHLTRVGGLEIVSGGLTKFTASNTISTPAGIRGNPAGFWAEVLFNSLTGATDARVMGTVVGATSGWSIYSYGTAALVNFSDGTAVRSSAFITIADNARTHVALRHTGTAMETYVNGVLSHTATFPAVAAAAGPMYLGAAGASSQPFLGGSGGDGIVPTPAEIATAAAAALATGKVVGIPGKTPKRWSAVDDVIDAGGKVPSIVRDRSGTDHAAVFNTKLEVAQRVEKLWSYEAA